VQRPVHKRTDVVSVWAFHNDKDPGAGHSEQRVLGVGRGPRDERGLLR
jgi:hypothetical protein